MRLTGPVPIQDEEFGTLKEGAAQTALGTIVVVLTILWLALKSPKIILAVFVSIFVGLVVTAALGLRMVGALNPISIAFAVLFVGIGVDFGIQFSVRYRAERYEIDDLRDRAGQHGQECRRAAHARGRHDRGGLFLVPADRLWRLFRARRDRRRRHDHRLSDQHHAPSRLAQGAQSARRKGAARLSRRSPRSIALPSATASRSSWAPR